VTDPHEAAPPGSLGGGECWVDADWQRDGGAAAAIVLEEGRLSLPDGSQLPLQGARPEDVAIAILAALAGRAAAAARRVGGPAAVNGRGLVARFTEILLGLEESQDRPSVIVDTIGSDEAIAEATRAVADLGTIVLAAPTEPSISLDLYPDVHLRGLTLVGLPLLADDTAPAPPEALAGLARGSLAVWHDEGEGALWFHAPEGLPPIGPARPWPIGSGPSA
jgi:hypothetical protein